MYTKLINKLLGTLAILLFSVPALAATDFMLGAGGETFPLGTPTEVCLPMTLTTVDADDISGYIITVDYIAANVTPTSLPPAYVAPYSTFSITDNILVDTPVAGTNRLTLNLVDFGNELPLGANLLGNVCFTNTAAAPAGLIPLTVVLQAANLVGNPGPVGVITSAGITVAADPVVMSITATDAAASEGGDTGAFELSCTGGDGVTAVPVAVTLGGTAPGADYAVAPAFPATIVCPGTAPAVIVTPVDNALVDGDRTVVATITPDAANFSIGTGSATVTIADDDVPPVLTITATNGEESSAGPTLTDGGFTLTCSAGNVATVNVAFTVSGTATSGTDYTALVASPVAVPCAGAIPVPVVVLADGDNAEFAESVTITLDAVTAGSGYTLGAAAAATSIIVGDLVSATPNVIPTLGTWAFILMTFALMFIAVPMVRRRQS